MVNALFKKNQDSIVAVELKGHAESSDDGYDMVCSAISAISYTIANGITEVLNIKPMLSLEDGFLNIDLGNLCEEEILKCQILLETMLLGFKNMEINYGDYINVETEEV
jgi:uncharacterized protein YsxB (DUF464 family)